MLSPSTTPLVLWPRDKGLRINSAKHLVPQLVQRDSSLAPLAQNDKFTLVGLRRSFASAGHKDFVAMQAQVQAGYMEIANELDAMVAPVGIAWQSGIAQDPQLGLWQMEGLHPTREGTYLSACVFYAVIFEQSSEVLTYRAGLSEERVRFLQAIAAETVLENPGRWNIP